MKKKEKTKITRERIIAAAVKEFGSNSYEGASINRICEEGNISKGLVYHNFSGKDDLYLTCLKESYDGLIKALEEEPPEITDPKEALGKFLIVRERYFRENPYYANIFFNSILQPPKNLKKEIEEERKGLNGYFSRFYLSLLDTLELRKGITKEEALEYFFAAGEMFNGYFQKKADETGDYRSLIEDHEEKLSSIFDIILYGVAKDPEAQRI